MTDPSRHQFGDRAYVARAHEDELVSELVRPHFVDSGEWVLMLSFAQNGRLLAVGENGGSTVHGATLTPAMIRAAFGPIAGNHLLLAHNHPSGELRPSTDDIVMTRQLASLCRMAGIALTDHLIMGRIGHFSFRAAGLI